MTFSVEDALLFRSLDWDDEDKSMTALSGAAGRYTFFIVKTTHYSMLCYTDINVPLSLSLVVFILIAMQLHGA